MKNRDLTKGNIIKNLLYMSIPAIISMIAQTAYSIVDMMWVGRISATAVASVTIFSALYILVISLNNIINFGSNTILSQSFGAGDINKTRKVLANTFSFKLLAGIVIGIIMYVFLKPALALFTRDSELLQMALEYGRIRTLFLPIAFLSFTVNGALRCSGDSRTPMIITMISAVLNIILDPIFMFDTIPVINSPGLGLGVFGAALATVVSVTISFLLSYWIMFGASSKYSLKLADIWGIDWNIALRILKIGFPRGLSLLVSNFAQLFLLKLVAIFGTLYVAVWGIMGRVTKLLFMPGTGFMIGGTTVVGQNVGAKQYEQAEKAGLVASKLAFALVSLICCLIFLFAKQVMAIFTSNSEVIDIGVLALRIAVFRIPIAAAYYNLSTIFAGYGYTIPYLVGAVVGLWVFQIPFAYICISVLRLPFNWLPVSFFVYALGEGLVFYYYYRLGKWRRNPSSESLTD